MRRRCTELEAESELIFFDTRRDSCLRLRAIGLRRGYRRAYTRFQHGPGAFKIDYALSAPVPWRAHECRRAITVHVGGTLEEIAASENAVAQGHIAERPFVLVAQPTLFDRSRAPEGKHILWAYCHVPNATNFEKTSIDMTERIEAQIERFAPGFRDCVLARHVSPPAALEAMNANLVGGDVSGGALNLRQTTQVRDEFESAVDGFAGDEDEDEAEVEPEEGEDAGHRVHQDGSPPEAEHGVGREAEEQVPGAVAGNADRLRSPGPAPPPMLRTYRNWQGCQPAGRRGYHRASGQGRRGPPAKLREQSVKLQAAASGPSQASSQVPGARFPKWEARLLLSRVPKPIPDLDVPHLPVCPSCACAGTDDRDDAQAHGWSIPDTGWATRPDHADPATAAPRDRTIGWCVWRDPPKPRPGEPREGIPGLAGRFVRGPECGCLIALSEAQRRPPFVRVVVQ